MWYLCFRSYIVNVAPIMTLWFVGFLHADQMLHESYKGPALVTFLQLVIVPSCILLVDCEKSSTPSDIERVSQGLQATLILQESRHNYVCWHASPGAHITVVSKLQDNTQHGTDCPISKQPIWGTKSITRRKTQLSHACRMCKRQTVELWDILCAGHGSHGSQETDVQTRLSHASKMCMRQSDFETDCLTLRQTVWLWYSRSRRCMRQTVWLQHRTCARQGSHWDKL